MVVKTWQGGPCSPCPLPVHTLAFCLPRSACLSIALQVYFLFEGLVVPAVLQSDNGTEFCAAVMQELCAMYGVKHVQGSVGHPQSQGAVERANKIVKDKIRAELMRAPTTR